MTGFSSKKQMANDRWLVDLIEDGEDLVLQFPDEMIEQTGWKTGDELIWEKVPNSEQAWTLRKKS